MRVLVTAVTVVLAASTALAQPSPAQTQATKPPSARVLPGTRSDAFSTIQGTALNANNTASAKSVVRLRDARSGRIVATTTTDRAGMFVFQNVDPGSYVVELLGGDKMVVAASGVLNVNAGEAISAIVKLPFKTPPLAGLLGNTVSSAALITASAAAAGVLATQISGEPASPVK